MASCKNSYSLITVFQLAILLISSNSSSADTNALRSYLCNKPPGNESSPWTANLNSVFDALQANVNLNNGYYRAEAEESPDRAFGLIQCRGDLSPTDCENCTRESFRVAARRCGQSKTSIIWQRWCVLRYSDTSFYGEWNETGGARSTTNQTSLDDPLKMMSGLAADAANDCLMFAGSEKEDGRGGKRYGLVQCTRDLTRSDCRRCLDHLLNQHQSFLQNRTAWEIYGVGCFMLYDDHQFYFNSSPSTGPTDCEVGSPTATNAANRDLGGWFLVGAAILAMAKAYL